MSEHGLEPILGAAYLMMDRAYVSISGSRARTLEVVLKSKSPAASVELDALGRSFRAELETQKVRWGLAKNNLTIRRYIVEQAVLLGAGSGVPAPESPEAGA
ncbi:MAG TPA: hypothetical protein VN915_03475 [Elusimicrobiota bacterium]|nr:hypothetical protein [Elusimicrobiota bacterium]